MDLALTDDQQAIAGLATDVFAGEVDIARILATEATDETIDRPLWATLAATGLLGVSLPEATGGTGGSAIELCCLLEQHGRSVAPVPLSWALVASMSIAAHGSAEQQHWVRRTVDGEAIVTVAGDLSGRGLDVTATERDGVWRLSGHLPAVAAPSADAVLVDAGTEHGLYLVRLDDPGVSRLRCATTDRLAHAHLTLDDVGAERVGDGADAVEHARTLLRIALAAVALGVAEEALQRAAAYTSQRHQFGKPLSSFQSTAHRAADAFIDTEAMRATLWQAASLLDDPEATAAEVLDAGLVAAWWAADAGPRVVQSVQHMHGGLGADTDYPVHRYYLWGTQLATELGGASALLAQLGASVTRRALTADRSQPIHRPSPSEQSVRSVVRNQEIRP